MSSKHKWMVRVTIDGKRRRVYFDTKREANEWRARQPFVKAAVRRVDY